MADLRTNVRYGVRRISKSPGFSVVVVATLALGIGANTAIFSVVNGLLLRPLPFPDPGELITITHNYPTLNDLEAPVSGRGFRNYRDRTHSFESMAVTNRWSPNLTGMDEPARLTGGAVTWRYFETFGIAPAIGRDFLPEDDEPGNNLVILISDGFWKSHFGSAPDVLGSTLQLDGEAHTIIGVMPPGFEDYYGREKQLWRQLALTSERLEDDGEWIHLVARVKDGVSVEQARAELSAFAETYKAERPDSYPDSWTLHVTTLDERLKGDMRAPLFLLLGAVGFVLLIACANVANLLLARSVGRIKEVAIRRALGSGRRELIAQLLTESVMLALAGGAAGLLLSVWAIRILKALGPDELVQVPLGLDSKVLIFTLVVSILTGILFGLLPALNVSRTDVAHTLREGGRTGRADRSGRHVQKALVVAEVALALTLLAGAGLLVRSFSLLHRVDPGFNKENLLTLNIQLPAIRYADDESRIRFFDQLLERVEAVPGVHSAGITGVLPFTGGWWTASFSIEGYEPGENEPGPWGDIRIVSPSYAATMEIPILKGRFLSPQDAEGSPAVAVVDEEMMRRYWPDSDPIGGQIIFGDPADPDATRIEVVGVVGHTMQEGLDADARIQLYASYRQSAQGAGWLVVRTEQDAAAMAPAIRAAVYSVDEDQPVATVATMASRIDDSIGGRKLSMLLLGLFAGLAMLLAALGVFGIMSHMVTERSHEMGIRMALGADASRLLGLVIRQGMLLAGIGVVAGLLGSLALSRLIESQLYEVSPRDPVTFVSVAAVLTAVALLSTWIPALRATRLDPVAVLRRE